MLAEPTIAPLPPPIQIRTHAAVPNNAPAAPAPARPLKPFPIQPGPFWDTPTERVIVWQVENPRCLFWRGAMACGLRHKIVGKTLYVKTTLTELAKLLMWSWEQK